MSNKIKKLVAFTTLTAAGLYAINRFIDYTAEQKNLLSSSNGEFYQSKQGKIFYTKHGNGSPVLLLHDLNPASSNAEWNKIVKKLERSHTVYSLDLLGCGRSDKPNITYTNYLYVQLLNEFIQNVIGEPTDVAATGLSASFTIMAQTFAKDNFRNIILINPVSFSELKKIPSENQKILSYLLKLPILGTSIYNVLMSQIKLLNIFSGKYYYNRTLLSEKLSDIYFEAAHKGKGAGKYLLASIEGNYINADFSKSIRNAQHVFIISSRNRKNHVQITDEYVRTNNHIEVSYISNSKYLPQQEVPGKFYEILSMFLN